MPLHNSTFQYLQPTEAQIASMSSVRDAGTQYAAMIELNVPDGPDKTYLLRKLREVGTWANIAITRQPDGSPRT